MNGYVIVFHRDMTARDWRIVGPFDTQAAAGDYAKKVYRKSSGSVTWVVIPLTDLATAGDIYEIEVGK